MDALVPVDSPLAAHATESGSEGLPATPTLSEDHQHQRHHNHNHNHSNGHHHGHAHALPRGERLEHAQPHPVRPGDDVHSLVSQSHPLSHARARLHGIAQGAGDKDDATRRGGLAPDASVADRILLDRSALHPSDPGHTSRKRTRSSPSPAGHSGRNGAVRRIAADSAMRMPDLDSTAAPHGGTPESSSVGAELTPGSSAGSSNSQIEIDSAAGAASDAIARSLLARAPSTSATDSASGAGVASTSSSSAGSSDEMRRARRSGGIRLGRTTEAHHAVDDADQGPPSEPTSLNPSNSASPVPGVKSEHRKPSLPDALPLGAASRGGSARRSRERNALRNAADAGSLADPMRQKASDSRSDLPSMSAGASAATRAAKAQQRGSDQLEDGLSVLACVSAFMDPLADGEATAASDPSADTNRSRPDPPSATSSGTRTLALPVAAGGSGAGLALDTASDGDQEMTEAIPDGAMLTDDGMQPESDGLEPMGMDDDIDADSVAGDAQVKSDGEEDPAPDAAGGSSTSGGHQRSAESGPSSGAKTDQESKSKDARRYQCQFCNKRFTRPSSLSTHIFTHTGERPFQCQNPMCGRSFSVLSNLRRHTRVCSRNLQRRNSVEERPQSMTSQIFTMLKNSLSSIPGSSSGSSAAASAPSGHGSVTYPVVVGPMPASSSHASARPLARPRAASSTQAPDSGSSSAASRPTPIARRPIAPAPARPTLSMPPPAPHNAGAPSQGSPGSEHPGSDPSPATTPIRPPMSRGSAPDLGTGAAYAHQMQHHGVPPGHYAGALPLSHVPPPPPPASVAHRHAPYPHPPTMQPHVPIGAPYYAHPGAPPYHPHMQPYAPPPMPAMPHYDQHGYPAYVHDAKRPQQYPHVHPAYHHPVAPGGAIPPPYPYMPGYPALPPSLQHPQRPSQPPQITLPSKPTRPSGRRRSKTSAVSVSSAPSSAPTASPSKTDARPSGGGHNSDPNAAEDHDMAEEDRASTPSRKSPAPSPERDRRDAENGDDQVQDDEAQRARRHHLQPSPARPGSPSRVHAAYDHPQHGAYPVPVPPYPYMYPPPYPPHSHAYHPAQVPPGPSGMPPPSSMPPPPVPPDGTPLDGVPPPYAPHGHPVYGHPALPPHLHPAYIHPHYQYHYAPPPPPGWTPAPYTSPPTQPQPYLAKQQQHQHQQHQHPHQHPYELPHSHQLPPAYYAPHHHYGHASHRPGHPRSHISSPERDAHDAARNADIADAGSRDSHARRGSGSSQRSSGPAPASAGPEQPPGEAPAAAAVAELA
ncbi:hypothetical protein HK105_204147 [Polyrhizophydium stewartii]|uniref:C2H2-type domain-containing protein n=1 Tax=Polyrhizophydium stewartii TaxID=2732419 RepID=A0ABR4NA19_9FUNG